MVQTSKNSLLQKPFDSRWGLQIEYIKQTCCWLRLHLLAMNRCEGITVVLFVLSYFLCRRTHTVHKRILCLGRCRVLLTLRSKVIPEGCMALQSWSEQAQHVRPASLVLSIHQTRPDLLHCEKKRDELRICPALLWIETAMATNVGNRSCL